MNIFENLIISEINSVAVIENTKGLPRRIVNRFAYAISFCISGQITYHFEEKNYVSTPGTVIFLPKGKSYTLTCEKSGTFPIINFECSNEIENPSIFCAKLESPEYFLTAFEKLRETFAIPATGRMTQSLAQFYNILSRLTDEVSLSNHSVLLPAIKYIEENFTSGEINNLMLAQLCHISEVYFRRIFAKAFGIPPIKYIRNLRIARAKELLKNNNIPITEVSESCGYSSVYHFCRAFKSDVGETPGDFRRKNISFWY